MLEEIAVRHKNFRYTGLPTKDETVKTTDNALIMTMIITIIIILNKAFCLDLSNHLAKQKFIYSETLNNKYIERIHQMSYSSLSDNGMLQIFSFLIK